MADRWANEAQYSHGFLVPIFAFVILWVRRDSFVAKAQPNLWGLALLAGAMLLSFVGARTYAFLDGASMLLALAGLVLFVCGWPALRWSLPAIAFLAFMLPLPHFVEVSLAQPLRRIATVCSTYALQTLGYPAIAQGNVILMDSPEGGGAANPYIELGVVDACNGLGMLMTFFALAVAAAVILPGPKLDRWLLVASAIPIALFVNVLRITATGMAHYSLGEKVGDAIMHDFAGWVMMPLAFGLLWLELKFIGKLLPHAESATPMTMPGWQTPVRQT